MAVRERKLPRARRYVAARRGAAPRGAPCTAAAVTRHARFTPITAANGLAKLPRDRLPDQDGSPLFRTGTQSKNTTTTAPGQLSHYAFSLARLVWLVGRCYGRRSSSGPTVYHLTHSHSCERERSVRVRNETRRDGNAETRSDQLVPDLHASVPQRDSAHVSIARAVPRQRYPRAPRGQVLFRAHGDLGSRN